MRVQGARQDGSGRLDFENPSEVVQPLTKARQGHGLEEWFPARDDEATDGRDCGGGVIATGIQELENLADAEGSWEPIRILPGRVPTE